MAYLANWQSIRLGTKHGIFNEIVFASCSDYWDNICHIEQASKPSIDSDKEPLPYVERSRIENKHVFEDQTGSIIALWKLINKIVTRNCFQDIHREKERDKTRMQILPERRRS